LNPAFHDANFFNLLGQEGGAADQLWTLAINAREAPASP
jgi:hypothetical protein